MGSPAGAATVGAVLSAVLDGLLDVAVALVAWWTLLYWAFWAADASLWTAGWIWAVGAVPIVGVLVLLDVRSRRADASAPEGRDQDRDETPPVLPWASGRPWLVVGLAGGSALCAVAAVVGSWALPGTFTWVQTLMVLALLGGTALALLLPRVATTGRARVFPWWQHLCALALSAGIAVLSLFILLPDLDDPYYLNRSVWIAEQGTSAVRDTMFGPETYVSPYNGGIPIASIEGLLGVLSHMTGLEVGTLTWIIATFVCSGMAVWVLWLLSRTWAPHAALLVTVVAVAFMLMSGESRLGNFWIARMWQGKVMAAAVLMPLAWVWATRSLSKDSWRPVVMLAVGGLAFAGLTSTAVILAPLMTGAMVVTGLLLRSSRLALGGALFLVGPVLSGAAVLLFSEDVGGKDPALLLGAESFARVLGQDEVMVSLAVLAIAVGPLLLRHRAARLMVALVSLAALVMLLPPLLRLANDLTGAGPILWRVLYCTPIALLVGLLAAPPLPDRLSRPARPLLTAVPAVVVLACIVLAGAPLWNTTDHNGPATLSSSPSWKVEPQALQDVRDVVATRPTGVILLPPDQMRILSMFTTEVFAVDPRDWYARTLKEPKPRNRYRIMLKTMAQPAGPPLPEAAVTRRALRSLEVTKVCVNETRETRRVVLRRALLAEVGYGEPTRAGRLTCYVPSAGGAG